MREESEAGNIFLDLSRSEDERTESRDEKDDGGCRKSYFHLKTFLENFSASSTCFFTHFLSLLPLSLSLSVLFSIFAFSSFPSFLPPPPPLNLCQRERERLSQLGFRSPVSLLVTKCTHQMSCYLTNNYASN